MYAFPPSHFSSFIGDPPRFMFFSTQMFLVHTIYRCMTHFKWYSAVWAAQQLKQSVWICILVLTDCGSTTFVWDYYHLLVLKWFSIHSNVLFSCSFDRNLLCKSQSQVSNKISSPFRYEYGKITLFRVCDDAEPSSVYRQGFFISVEVQYEDWLGSSTECELIRNSNVQLLMF